MNQPFSLFVTPSDSSRIIADYTCDPHDGENNRSQKEGSRVMTMTPSDKKLLEAYLKEIAKILYKNTPPEKIETFEGIETAVREQVLETTYL